MSQANGNLDPLERGRDTESGDPHAIVRHDHVAWIQPAMDDTGGGRRVERDGDLTRKPHDILDRQHEPFVVQRLE